MLKTLNNIWPLWVTIDHHSEAEILPKHKYSWYQFWVCQKVSMKINELEEETEDMDKTVDDLNRAIDRHGQFFHITCILVHVIKEYKIKDIPMLSWQIF